MFGITKEDGVPSGMLLKLKVVSIYIYLLLNDSH